MRLLVVGNHACSNRGDAAILRGLLAGLEREAPRASIDVLSRHPVSARYVLGRDVAADRLSAFRGERGRTRLARAHRRATTRLMLEALEHPRLRYALPRAIVGELERLREYDAVVQVGGSFFVDVYGDAQYDYALASFLAGVPLLLMGHSLGPFGTPESRALAGVLLARAAFVGLREPVSLEVLRRARLPHDRVHMGSDTAWLVPAQPVEAASGEGGRPRVALTLRELAPFDRSLGIAQADYEAGVARLADALLARGYDLVLASTCTGLDSYHRDDRMPALRIKERSRHPERCEVVMAELSDLELGRLFARCVLVVGTRLHSAIIAMNFGTPAATLNYEHKSEGTMAQLGLSELSFPLSSVVDGSVVPRIERLLALGASTGERVEEAVSRERERARSMLREGLARVGSAEARRERGTRRPPLGASEPERDGQGRGDQRPAE